MAPTTLTVEMRARYVWVMHLACIPVWIPLPMIARRAWAEWCWDRVIVEYRSGGRWIPLRKPELELD